MLPHGRVPESGEPTPERVESTPLHSADTIDRIIPIRDLENCFGEARRTGAFMRLKISGAEINLFSMFVELNRLAAANPDIRVYGFRDDGYHRISLTPTNIRTSHIPTPMEAAPGAQISVLPNGMRLKDSAARLIQMVKSAIARIRPVPKASK